MELAIFFLVLGVRVRVTEPLTLFHRYIYHFPRRPSLFFFAKELPRTSVARRVYISPVCSLSPLSFPLLLLLLACIGSTTTTPPPTPPTNNQQQHRRHRQDGVAVVEEVSTYNGGGGRKGGPFPGDELTHVAGVPTSRLSYGGVVDRIRSCPRPITLRFR